jgi:ribosomal protein S18 acetylase RimI-like enzyme
VAGAALRRARLTGNGVGAALVGFAKARRPGGLRLWTFVSNERAQRFYERWGFEEVERTDGHDNEERSPDILYAWAGA